MICYWGILQWNNLITETRWFLWWLARENKRFAVRVICFHFVWGTSKLYTFFGLFVFLQGAHSKTYCCTKQFFNQGSTKARLVIWFWNPSGNLVVSKPRNNGHWHNTLAINNRLGITRITHQNPARISAQCRPQCCRLLYDNSFSMVKRLENN